MPIKFQSESESSVSTGVNGRVSSIYQRAKNKDGQKSRLSIVHPHGKRPLAVIEKTAKAAPKLEPGDIILADSIRVPGFIHSLVRKGSTATQGGLNHAAIYTGDGKMVEGRIKRGVKKLSLRKGTKGLSYTVVRPNLPKRIRKKAARIAERQVGKEYSSADLVRTGALLGLLPDKFRKNLVGEKATTDIDSDDEMQCAALVAGAYAKAGKRLTNLNYKYVAPVDLLSKTDSKIIKMTKRRGDRTQGTPFTFTSSAKQAKEKLKKYMSKEATVGCLNVKVHAEAEAWAPPVEALRLANDLLHKPVQVCIYPRHMVKTIWEQDHIDRRYDKDLYAFRAYAGKDYCRIFVDETETPESALWVFFHELAHIALTASPYLFKAYRFLTPPDYFMSDDAHERDPEEQMANAIAGAYMKMLNYDVTDYPRHWWRNRVDTMSHTEKLASIYKKRHIKEAYWQGALVGGTLLGGRKALKESEGYFADKDKVRQGLLSADMFKMRNKDRALKVGLHTAGGAAGGATLQYLGKKAIESYRNQVDYAQNAAADTLNRAEQSAGNTINKAEQMAKATMSEAVNNANTVMGKAEATAKKTMEEANLHASDILNKAKSHGSGLMEEARAHANNIVNNAGTNAERVVNNAGTQARTTVSHAAREAEGVASTVMDDAVGNKFNKLMYGTQGGPKPPHPGGLAGQFDAWRESTLDGIREIKDSVKFDVKRKGISSLEIRPAVVPPVTDLALPLNQSTWYNPMTWFKAASIDPDVYSFFIREVGVSNG